VGGRDGEVKRGGGSERVGGGGSVDEVGQIYGGARLRKALNV